MWPWNGTDYVIGSGKFQEEVVDNKVIGKIDIPIICEDNDVHSEIFGEDNWAGNDDNCT